MGNELRDRLLSEGDACLLPVRLYVVDVEVEFSRTRCLVRWFVDRQEPGVVSIDDCARASKALQRWLDDSRLLGEDYVIEVSSPGIERRVARPQDFRRFAGRRVRVRCRTLVDGKRNFEGILEAAGEDGLTVREGEQRFALSYAIVARANLAVEPREGGKGHGDQPQ